MESLEHKIGYTFQDRSLLQEALTHSSYANERHGRVRCNERMEPIANPFDAADREVHRLKEAGAHIILIDFHAEATAEKRALGYYLDGRVSALFGTHTHVQTADEQVLPGGTGYITDLGMTGPQHSVLGVSPQAAIEKMRTGLPVRFTNPDGPCVLEGCLFDIDEKTGKTRSCTRIRR